ncbi:MAG: ferredoxin-type protein NapG [Alphaproteobacteria bacterium]|nr:ferredoxin-type protein NapG [Alphaproteobacteria bacterium]
MAGKGGPSDWVGRRRLIEDAARAACGVGLAACALGFAATGGVKPAHALRPPGARDEAGFLSACVKCGLCVRACPYGTLRLATLGDGVAVGSPYFVARDVPCEMCETIPCVVACPTGALDPALKDINRADMGVAALVGRETCLNLQGLRCDVCYRVCPVIDKAITLEATHNTRTGKHAVFEPVVHAEHCTGCGKCEKSCVLEAAAIRVLPRDLAQGRGGAHYRYGWREKEKAGAPLVSDTIRLPERLPEAKP